MIVLTKIQTSGTLVFRKIWRKLEMVVISWILASYIAWVLISQVIAVSLHNLLKLI